MRTTATAAEIDRFRRDGYLVVEELLAPSELEALTAAVECAVADTGGRPGAERAWSDGDSWYAGVFVQRIHLWKNEPGIRRVLLGPELGNLALALAGATGLRLWHDQTLQKGPWANPTSWHLDNPSWSFTSDQAISAWIALDDATIANGCMWFMPGSHRLARPESCGITPAMGELFRSNPQLAGLRAEPACVPRGGCIFHNGLTAHAAGPNMTPHWRRALVGIYMPADSVFNGIPNILPAERLARLRPGDPLRDEVEHPLVAGCDPGAAPLPDVALRG